MKWIIWLCRIQYVKSEIVVTFNNYDIYLHVILFRCDKEAKKPFYWLKHVLAMLSDGDKDKVLDANGLVSQIQFLPHYLDLYVMAQVCTVLLLCNVVNILYYKSRGQVVSQGSHFIWVWKVKMY